MILNLMFFLDVYLKKLHNYCLQFGGFIPLLYILCNIWTRVKSLRVFATITVFTCSI